MTKKKAKKSSKAKPPVTKARAKAEAKAREKNSDMVVFAFRLLPEERDLIHKAAGPAKASKFVRALTVAAARGDAKAVGDIVGAVQ